MKKYSLIVLFLIFVTSLFAQEPADTIRMVKQNGSLRFYQGTKEYTFLKLAEPMKQDMVAYQYYKQAKVNRTFHGILFGTGFVTACFGLMYGVGQGLEENDPNQVWIGLVSGIVVGGGIMALSIPFGKSYKKDLNLALKHYNRNLGQPVSSRPVFRAGISENGISLQLKF